MSTFNISTLTYFETYFRSITIKFQNFKSLIIILKYFVTSLSENCFLVPESYTSTESYRPSHQIISMFQNLKSQNILLTKKIYD